MKYIKKLLIIFTSIALSLLATYLLFFDKKIVIDGSKLVEKTIVKNSADVFLASGVSFSGNINLVDGDVVINSGVVFTGDIILEKGNVTIDKNVKMFGNIETLDGNIYVNENSEINGNIESQNGKVSLGENVIIFGNVVCQNYNLYKTSYTKITGSFPNIFITTNRPSSLVFFDVLPENHKESLGYLFLTKGSNTIIREDDIDEFDEYFDGIYYYSGGQLNSIDLEDKELKTSFFNHAKVFFTGLPERRLGPYSVGACTLNHSYKRGFADIYVPSIGSKYTLIHEMGHVVDFMYNYSDYHNPSYPRISKEAALNSYGATHIGEDFAEGYKYYILSRNYFVSDLIANEPTRQEKYNYLKKYVFDSKEFK